MTETIMITAPGEGAPVAVRLERAGSGSASVYLATLRREETSAGAPRAAEVRREVEVARTGPGAGRLRVEGRVVPFRFCRRGERLFVWAGGRTYEFRTPSRTARRAAAGTVAGGASDLTAPMPGTVLKILARSGARFDAHEALIVMESMKMEMTLSAPEPVTVVEIMCTEGQLVEMGAALARLQSSTDAAAGRRA